MFRCSGAFRLCFSPDGEWLACLSRAPRPENRNHTAESGRQGATRRDTGTVPTRAWPSPADATNSCREDAAPPPYRGGGQAIDGRGAQPGGARGSTVTTGGATGQQIQIWGWRRAERSQTIRATGGPFRDLAWMPQANHGGGYGGGYVGGDGGGGYGGWNDGGGGFGSSRGAGGSLLSGAEDLPRLVALGRRTLVFFSFGRGAAGGASPVTEAAVHGETGPPA
eukprot:scaffold16019_cov62-Isochrysis_galbana.AAC.1